MTKHRRKATSTLRGDATPSLGFEAKLWQAADALRNNMDAAEYKHVVLGLIFLKYISDAFEAKHAELAEQEPQGADPEDPDEYRAASIFWVPKEARWQHLKANAPQPAIGRLVDDAMTAIEQDNHSLKGVLPKDYARPGLDKQRLGQLINLVSDIGLGSPADRAKDILGRVYEYFLAQFASAEGKKGGQFYTPSRVVQLLVEMLAPYKGRVYDPCCGSGGMFVSSEKFIEAHSGKIGDISIYGQESNYTTWRLAKMNLAVRGIDGQIAHGDSFHNDRNPDLKADYILANPPFNDSDWRGELLKDDKRWVYGVPPSGNANFAWVQHFIHHLAPTGLAGFVLANGSMSSNQSGEGEIRQNIVRADLVDCMVALPGQLFYSTPIPVCLWFLARDKRTRRFRDRRGWSLFIDARKLGTMIDRVHRDLTDQDIRTIVDTYHAWRGDGEAAYEDIDGFCHACEQRDIADAGFDLNPGRYVGTGYAGTAHLSLRSEFDEAASDASEVASRAQAGYGEVFAAVKELDSVLQVTMGAIAARGRPGVLKDLAVTSRTIVNPSEQPDQFFDLYSIPAFDATGLPERVLGKAVLSGKLLLDADALLVSKLNPRNHRVWPVRVNSRHSICSTEFVVLRPKDGLFFDYLYLHCISSAFQDHLVAHATGSTGSRQRVTVRDLLAAPIVLPDLEDAWELTRVVRPLRLRLEALASERHALTRLISYVSNFVIARRGFTPESEV